MATNQETRYQVWLNPEFGARAKWVVVDTQVDGDGEIVIAYAHRDEADARRDKLNQEVGS